MLDRVVFVSKILVVAGVATWLGIASMKAFTAKNEGVSLIPIVKGQVGILVPRDGQTVAAGINEVRGMGLAGEKVEVLDGNRVIGVAWGKDDGSWSTRGKFFGTEQKLVAVTVPQRATSSPVSIKVAGTAAQTLTITSPPDQQYIEKGWLTVAGKGKAGDSLLLSYLGRARARVTVDRSGNWSVRLMLRPAPQGEIRVVSTTEAEIARIQVVSGPS